MIGDYGFYLVDTTGRSGALKISNARFFRAEQVLEWLRLDFHQYCVSEELCTAASLKWVEERGLNTGNAVRERLAKRTTKAYWYDNMVKCYPIGNDGRIIKNHDVVR